MILTRLELNSFRNIRQLSLAPHPGLNLITGDNGAGKSSVLEAVQCLSTGHSFRTRKPRELICHDTAAFTLSASFVDPHTSQEHRAGLLRRRDGTTELRLDFETISGISDVTRLLPVKALTPDSHRLVQEGPEERRRFLDCGVFHVEPSFFDIWKRFRRSLSQRNQLLRDNAPEREIRLWDDLFAAASVELDALRREYVKSLATALEDRLTSMGVMFHVKLSYRSGWSDGDSLAELLVRNLETHRRMKTTTEGPHRAEMAIYSDDVPARQVLSRGQHKTLVYLLHLAQLDLLALREARQAIVLCDDLTSELDAINSTRLVEQLLALDGQLFVSGVTLDVLKSQEHRVFHMKHGEIKT